VRPVFYSSYDVWGKTKDIGRLCGAVGDMKYFDPMVEVNALKELDLSSSRLNDGQIISRAYYATFMNEWAVTASIVAKIATDIRLLAMSEVQEVKEGRSKGQMGSSSMPQKRNPIGSENLCGLARVIRGYQATAMQNIELWLERDISHSSAERIIFPDAAVILGYMLTRLDNILKNLDVDHVVIDQNLKRSSQGMEAQDKMLKLIDEGLSRREAHEMMRKKSGLE
jgi:adenylosuccinate lyase